MARKVAFVTGASRGIGKACAVYLARAGFDVAITARTVDEGERRDHSPTIKEHDLSPLPGSLQSTAEQIRIEGREVMVVPADIVEPVDLGVAAATVSERWGGVDVLVNAARFVGPGHMDRFMDTPIAFLRKHIDGNVLAPMILSQQLIPGMIRRGGGTIINFTSGAGFSDPLKPAGEGGWGACYGVSKAALHRLAGILAVELGSQGIRAYNVSPGFTTTERINQDEKEFGFGWEGAPVDVSGAVTAWLATDPEAGNYNGQTIIAQKLCFERDLLPGWKGPPAIAPSQRYDYFAAENDTFNNDVAAGRYRR
jgi:NAD(P)-dependent dehydrogenase (short-subunit alcohol dehydrogenase family)